MKEKNEKGMMKKKSNKEMIVIFVPKEKRWGKLSYEKKASSLSSFVISSQVTSFGFLDVESCVRWEAEIEPFWAKLLQKISLFPEYNIYSGIIYWSDHNSRKNIIIAQKRQERKQK